MIKVDETDPVGEVEPAFPYRDVTVRRGIDFNNHYNLDSELGRGKFGTVYLCNDKKNALKLAVKMVNTTKKEDRRAVEREVEIMRRLQHPRLIQLYDAIDTGKQFYVILELIEGGELFERVIDDDFVLTERSCAVFMRQICEGVEFIHTQNILHLDLKPENILCLTKEGNRIKIIDFGLARHFDPRKKLQVLFGTPEFVAPEVVNFDQIGFGTDMWSIGVICYVLLSGLSPFMGDTDVETMANVTIAKYDFDHEAFANISEDAKDFIRCLLIKDKEKRSTAAQCRNHLWLAGRNSSKDNSSSKVKEKMKETTKKKKKKDDEELKEFKEEVEVKEKKLKLEMDLGLAKENKTNDIKLKNELDMTKDNLRIFVERWREHPNSPYMIDDSIKLNNLELPRNNNESISLCGENPSPPPSIISDINSDTTSTCNNFGLSQNFIIPTLTLERRASEGYYKDNQMINHHYNRDQASQIILAEEIIKLSEHLRSIAQISTTDSNNKQTNDKKLIINNKNINNNNSRNDVNEISEKLSSIKQQRKLNGTTFNGNRNNNTNNNSSSSNNNINNNTSSKNKNSTNGNNKKDNNNLNTLKLQKLKETIDDDGDNNSTSREIRKTTEDVTTTKVNDIDLIPPWRKSKVKHRFGEMCRDVPRISNLKDIHKTMNLDEPTSAKNLLLQLLEEWDDRSGSFNIGRKSISVDLGQENIARKSISSLTEYFQSEQQRPKTTIDQPHSPSPSTSTSH